MNVNPLITIAIKYTIKRKECKHSSYQKSTIKESKKSKKLNTKRKVLKGTRGK